MQQTDLTTLSIERLAGMSAATGQAIETLRVPGKSGIKKVGRMLEHQGEFAYHAHRSNSGEHVHFQTFLRAAAFRLNTAPASAIVDP